MPVAWKRADDWKTMLEALSRRDLPEDTRKKLTASWKNEILSPYRKDWFYGARAKRDARWVEWLLESLVDRRKGIEWFQAELERWLAALSAKATPDRDDVRLLRLLTADLVEVLGRKALAAGSKFFEVVVQPSEGSAPDQASRRKFLKQALPEGLEQTLMACWRKLMPSLVPRPEQVQRSDYGEHARWMAALREIAPERFTAMLEAWRAEHPKRRNLWAALQAEGIR